MSLWQGSSKEAARARLKRELGSVHVDHIITRAVLHSSSQARAVLGITASVNVDAMKPSEVMKKAIQSIGEGFASYLQRAGGCDKIQNIVCEATNMVALVHYRQRAAADSSIAAALQCLEKRCNLN